MGTELDKIRAKLGNKKKKGGKAWIKIDATQLNGWLDTERFPCNFSQVNSAQSNKATYNNNMCWSEMLKGDSTHLHNAFVWMGGGRCMVLQISAS